MSNVLIRTLCWGQAMEALHNYPLEPAPITGVVKITTTRHCWMQCRFCDFSHFTPVLYDTKIPSCLPLEVAESRLAQMPSAVGLIKIRGGLSFREPFTYFRSLVKTVADGFRGPIQAFSPIEVNQWHRVEQRPVRELLAELKWAGATGLGPGGSEILVQSWRDRLSPHRIEATAWANLAQLGWEIGLPPSAMILAGQWLSESDIKSHLQILSAYLWHHIEVKVFRAVARQPELEAMHILSLCRLVSETRDTLADTPIYVNEPPGGLSHDARILLSRAGADGFYTTLEAIEP